MKSKVIFGSIVGSVVLFLGTSGMATPVNPAPVAKFASHLSADRGEIEYADASDDSSDNSSEDNNTDLGSNDGSYSPENIYDYTSHISTVSV